MTSDTAIDVFTKPLTVNALRKVAGRTAKLTVSSDLVTALRNAAQTFGRVAEQRPIYGRSTGVGANRTTAVADATQSHGLHLVRSHAVDGGEPLTREVTRMALAIRLRQLAIGVSGIQPEIVQALAAMLERDSLPTLRDLGAIGTGDLPALASLALTLLGERPADPPFPPLAGIGADSALPLLSSSAVTIARAASTLIKLEELFYAQLGVFCLSALAACANREAFSVAISPALGRNPFSSRIATTLQTLLTDTTWEPLRIQDPYAFRAYLPSSIVLLEEIERLKSHVEELINCGQENPLIDIRTGQVYHHGAFYQASLAHILDCLGIALAQNAPLAVGRIRSINDDSLSKLPRFLAPFGHGTSGTMIIEYLAADAASSLLMAGAPICTQSAFLSCGVEDGATFAPAAVRKLEDATAKYRLMIACEQLVAVRAISLRPRGFAHIGAIVQQLVELAGGAPRTLEDHDLHPDVLDASTRIPSITEYINTIAPFRK